MVAVKKDEQKSNGLASVLAVGCIVLAIGLFIIVLIQMGLIPLQKASASSTVHAILVTKEMNFGQSEIIVAAGEVVNIQLRNADLYAHSFDIDSLDVHVPLGSRDSEWVTFAAPEPGVYSFYCAVPGHEEAGMVGTLIVN